MKTIPFILCIFVSTTFMSCQKEISDEDLPDQVNVPNTLLGNWKFINTHALTTSTVEINDGFSDVKSVTTSEYTTLNNMGDITIDDSVMASIGISYDVSTNATIYSYEDGTLSDSTVFPFNFSLPPTNSRNTYQLIGTDSIYAPGGGLDQLAGTPAGLQFAPSGMKYQLTGDTLKFMGYIDQRYIDSSLGIPVNTWDKASVVTTLARQ